MKTLHDSSMDGNLSADFKLSRDPATGQQMVEFLGNRIVLKSDTSMRDLEETGLAEIKEAQL